MIRLARPAGTCAVQRKMKSVQRLIHGAVFALLMGLVLVGCSSVDPRKVDIEMPKGTPELKLTSFTQALSNLGRMSEIYGESVRIQVDNIIDDTGTAQFTKAEIPIDITEMTKSALNSIGGNVVFIPYNPNFMITLSQIGYSNFDSKFIPDVILTGGITEFDRGLETREDRVNVGYQTTHFGEEAPVGLEYDQGAKGGLAKISVDFNLVDFQTMSGIRRMQTTNSIAVHKVIAQKELGFTLFGPTFGLRGKIKKVEGRHGAVRLLVQLSVIQLVGKYLDLPYWRLLPNGKPDPVVIGYVRDGWRYQMDERERIAKVQELLYLHGYTDLQVTGIMDEKTRAAVEKFAMEHGLENRLDLSLYQEIYFSVPLDEAALERRYQLARRQQAQAVVRPQAGQGTVGQRPETQQRIESDALDQLFEKLHKE